QPKRAPVTVEQVMRWTRPLDALLVLSVVALTFLLASFAARLGDFLLNLASGRALFDGSYKLGEDPFAFTPQGVRWVNHSWLYDASIYLLYRGLGGQALVVLKALAMAILGGFMLAVRRSGQSLWIPAVCTGIAVLAVSQRVFLQPIVLSYLFLGITLYSLQRPAAPLEEGSKRRPAVPAPRRHLWLLPLLFLLWVNVDTWFFLGPVTVALFWVGELIQDLLAPVREGPDRRGPADNRTLGLVLLAGLVACLVNPHHVYAFLTLPPQFAAAGGILQGDAYFGPIFWDLFDYYKRGFGWSAVGIANLVLVGLGLLSFAANHRDWRCWRILIWTAFA